MCGGLIVFATALAEPTPLAGTPPSASRFAPMLSGDAPTIGAAKARWVSQDSLSNTALKPTRVGVRVDDIGAKRLEEARIPRDGGLRGGVQNAPTTKQMRNRHERVCGPPTLERSDWRWLAHPEMAVERGSPPKAPLIHTINPT